MSIPQPMLVKGYQGSVAFDGQSVTIRHTAFAPGGRSERTFTIAQISGVEVKKAGVSGGAFTLVVAGAVAPQSGFMARRFDPLTVEFLWGQGKPFFALRDAVLAAINQHHTRPQRAFPSPQPQAPSLAGDLSALADMRDRGVLTPAEFHTITSRLLGTLPPG